MLISSQLPETASSLQVAANNLLSLDQLCLHQESGGTIDHDDPYEFDRVFGPPRPPPLPSAAFLAERVVLEEEDNCGYLDDGDEEIKRGADSSSISPRGGSNYGVEDFEVLKVVGKGAYGKVYQVREKKTSETYAMKVIRKDKIIGKHQSEYIRAEREILSQVDHPFIVNLICSFQTKYRLYIVLDFVNGGHLLFQLRNHGLFREDLARIYAAEIVSALSYLHENDIMHRDLKPENILLDAGGHIKLADFGMAKASSYNKDVADDDHHRHDEEERANSMCGTLEYMAPEILVAKGHDKAVDWWSFGVLLFEMLTGKPPFTGGNRRKLQQKILKEGKIKLPQFLSSEAHSLLKGLLQREPGKRLGSGPKGGDEIKKHKWFRSINWNKLESRGINPSFVPQVSGKDCIANFDELYINMPLLDSPATSPKKSGQDPFVDFNCVQLTVVKQH